MAAAESHASLVDGVAMQCLKWVLWYNKYSNKTDPMRTISLVRAGYTFISYLGVLPPPPALWHHWRGMFLIRMAKPRGDGELG